MERFDLEVKANNLIRKMIGAEPYITQKSLTNADRLDAMTIEEKARFLAMIQLDLWDLVLKTFGTKSDIDKEAVISNWIEWLEQEVDDGDQTMRE